MKKHLVLILILLIILTSLCILLITILTASFKMNIDTFQFLIYLLAISVFTLSIILLSFWKIQSTKYNHIQTSMDHIVDAVIITNSSDKIIFINSAAAIYTNKSLKEVIGKNFKEVFNLIDEKTPILVLPGSDYNTLRSVTVTINPIQNRYNKYPGHIYIFKDQTHSNVLESELVIKDKQESLKTMIKGFTHDFTNIMMAIMGNVELIKLLFKSGSKMSGLLENIEKALLNERVLFQKLLLFARGGGKSPKTNVNITELLNKSVESLVQNSPVKYSFDIPSSSVNIKVDPDLMHEVFNYILLNAMESMPDGGLINIQFEKRKDFLHITFRDHGIGIKKEYLNKIYDPFFSTKGHGRGLGLSVAYTIIKNYGGKIHVISEQDKGTTLTLLFPLENI